MRRRMRTRRNPNLALAMAFLSMLSVFNSLFAFLILDPNVRGVVVLITEYLSLLFVLNFVYRFLIADSRTHYLAHEEGWADLLACIPYYQISWIFRGLRAYLTFRRISFAQAREDVRREGAEFYLFIGTFLVTIILEACAVSVLHYENQSAAANIKTSQDALWWAYVTMSGVGYGDKYPITSGGRMVGIILMTAGLGFYATIIGYFARRLIYRRGRMLTGPGEEEGLSEIGDKVQTLEKKGEETLERLKRIEALLEPSDDKEKEIPR